MNKQIYKKSLNFHLTWYGRIYTPSNLEPDFGRVGGLSGFKSVIVPLQHTIVTFSLYK